MQNGTERSMNYKLLTARTKNLYHEAIFVIFGRCTHEVYMHTWYDRVCVEYRNTLNITNVLTKENFLLYLSTSWSNNVDQVFYSNRNLVCVITHKVVTMNTSNDFYVNNVWLFFNKTLDIRSW